jgi:aspartate/methionine/tyrosine aminotransferase
VKELNQVKGSEYIHWAKTLANGRFNLATSGVVNYPISQLNTTIEEIDLSGPSLYGYEPLLQALAAKLEVEPDCIVHATGTSMANHLAMAATLEPGDEVLIEKPAYEPLLAVARYLGANIKRFTRRAENDFLIETEQIEREAGPRTRLIVLTNLHNPTSAFADSDTLKRIREIAARVGARVLVDEVYLEAMFESAPRSAFHLGGEFIVTSSLTKAYGLSGLRCGWAVAERELAGKMWRLNDIFGVIPAHPAERLSVVALNKLDRIRGRARRLLENNRAMLDSFLDTRDDLECARPQFGTVAFPHLLTGDVETMCRLLRQRYETTVVPGNFFEMPDHFRIGIGCEPSVLSGGLERLGAALDELRASNP